MMDHNVIFRSGKWQGYSVGEICIKDPKYIQWVKENRPEMLKSHKKKLTPANKQIPQKIKPMTEEQYAERNWGKVEPGDINDAF